MLEATSALQEAIDALREVESTLRLVHPAVPDTPPAPVDPLALAARVHHVIGLLAVGAEPAPRGGTEREPSIRPRSAAPPAQHRRWIGTTHARRLLGVGSENTVKTWVRYGYLRGRVLPNGRTQVRLDDVLRLQVAARTGPEDAAPHPPLVGRRQGAF